MVGAEAEENARMVKIGTLCCNVGSAMGLSVFIYFVFNFLIRQHQQVSFKSHMRKELYPLSHSFQENRDSQYTCWPFLTLKDEDDEIRENIE